MREGITPTEVAAFLAGDPFTVRVTVGGVNMSDVFGGDWVTQVRFSGESPDRPAGEFTVTFLHSAGGVSAAPGIAGSPVNTGGERIRAGRAIDVSISLDDGAYKPWLSGTIEDVEWAGHRVVATCLTLDGDLVATEIEEEVERNVPPEGENPEDYATPVEDEIQYLLDTWAPGTTLRVIGTPGWKVGAYTPSGSLGDQIRMLAQQNAWDCRYRWSEADQAFRLTLYNPPRDKVMPDFLLAKWDTLAVDGLRQSRQWVRNAFTIDYLDAVTGERTQAHLENTASIGKYGRRWMKLIEDDASPIDSEARALALLGYASNDLAEPLADGRYRIPFLPWAQLHDVVALQADGIHYDHDTASAVVGVTHEIDGERGAYTVLETRGGKPVGMFLEWQRRGQPGAFIDPPITLDLIYRGSDGGIRHYEVVTHNAPAEVETWVYWKIFDSPIDEDWLEELIQPANRHTVLEDGGSGEFTTAQPPAGTILKGIVVAMRPTDDGYTVVGDGVEFEADGSEAPIHVGEPKFVENPAGTHSTFSVTIGDPRGVVTGVDVFLSVGASASGPHAATKSGDTYSYQFALDHDHVTIVRARINRDDGGEPIWLGPYTADTDKIPDIPDVAITWVADDAYVQVDCEDTDAVSLWRQKVVGGVPGTEVQIPARGADPRFGSFTETHVTEEVRYRVYAKNAAGTAGEYRDVRIVPPQLAQFLATHARITDATASTITVTVDADPDTAEVELLDDTTATRTSGPNVGVKSPSGTVWVFSRPAAGSGPRMAWFRSTLADHVSDDDGVVIPEIGQGVVPLIVRARVTASSSNSMTVQVRVADPTPQNNITLSYVAQDVAGINPGSPQTISAANVTDNLDTTGFINFAVPRPAVGASDGSVSFTATSSGRIADVDSVTVPAQVPPVMRVDTAEDQAHPSGPRGIVTLSPLPGAVYDSVQFASQAGNANPTSWGNGNLGALSHYVPLHTKHSSAIGYRVQRSGVVVQQDWVRGFDVGEVAEVLTIDVRESGTGTVAIVFECDTDTAIGSGNVRFRLDGGPTYTSLTVNAQRLASTLEIGGISQSTMGAREIAVQARNRHGAWGPEKIGSIPVYVEAAAPTGVITEALLANVSQGFCGAPDQEPPLPATPIKNEVTWKVSGTVPAGTQIYVERWLDEAGGVIAGGPFPFANGSYMEEIHGYRLGAGPGDEHRIQYRVRTNNDKIPVAWTNTIRQKWVLCS